MARARRRASGLLHAELEAADALIDDHEQRAGHSGPRVAHGGLHERDRAVELAPAKATRALARLQPHLLVLAAPGGAHVGGNGGHASGAAGPGGGYRVAPGHPTAVAGRPGRLEAHEVTGEWPALGRADGHS